MDFPCGRSYRLSGVSTGTPGNHKAVKILNLEGNT